MDMKTKFGLPNSIKYKTFADASKFIENKFKNRNSVIDTKTKETLLSRLRDVQEIERQKLKVQEDRINNQMDGGGPVEELQYQPSQLSSAMANYPEYTPPTSLVGTSNPTSELGTNILGAAYSGSSNNQSWLSNKFGKDSWWGRNEGDNTQSVLGGIGLATSVIAPMIANRRAMKSLQAPQQVSAGMMGKSDIQPNFVNRQQLLRNLAQQAGTQRHFMSQAGGNWAQYTSGLANLNANLLSSSGNLMLQSDMADSQEKARVQGMSQNVDQFNIQQRMRADEINSQNMGAYNSQMAAYKQAQGANIGNIGMSLWNMMQAKKYGKYAKAAEITSNMNQYSNRRDNG